MTKNIDDENTIFEHAELTKITGVPTYEALKQIKDECATNASLVESNLGGGAHGLSGLVFSATEYALLSAIPFVRPAAPGPLVLPAGPGVTNFQRELARDAHKETLRVFHEVTAVEKALIKQVCRAVPELYIKSFRHPRTNVVTTTLSDLLTRLFTSYGTVTDDELQKANSDLSDRVFDITLPLIDLYNEVENLKSLSIAAENK